jgi:uncharacterized protein (DUF885 family)
MNTEFLALVNAFLGSEFEKSPVLASALGLTDYDDRLDDLSAEAILRHEAESEEWRVQFEGVSEDDLSEDERIDRALVLSVLRGRSIMAEWAGWKRDPMVYVGVATSAVFPLFLHRLRPEADLVDAAVARMGQMPALLQSAASNLDANLAHPLIVGRGLAAAKGASRYFRDLLPAEVDDPAGRERMAQAGATVADAFDSWIEMLGALETGARGDWRFGEERYSRILLEKEMLDVNARGLRERGQAEYDRLDAEMRALSKEAFGDEDYPGVLERANANHPPTEEAMRETYEDWTERARQFLIEHGLATLPEGERCVVEPSPVFQRPVIGVASYQSPPAFSDSMLGHFFVPFAPDGTPEEEIQQRLEMNNYGDIPTTSVHEAYPGHHWHLVMRKQNRSRMRRVYSTSYFSEGWALYTERMMRERGFFTEPIQELYHLNATIFRAARIIVDTSLHLGDMTFDEAVRFMVERAALPEPTARAEVGRYCWWPTQASSYLTGCLDILDMRRDYLNARGLDGVSPAEVDTDVLRDFHDAITSSGALPLGLARRAVMATVP